jgi:hypothetical protein
MSIQEDLVNKAIQNGIYGMKRGIELTMKDPSTWGSALILIYSGIDAMGSLGMPAGRIKNEGQDFKNWVSRYLKDSSGQSYPAEDMWGARCAILHQYGAESEKSREEKCRVIAHVRGGPAIKIVPMGGEKEHVWLELPALEKNFYSAIDKFVMDSIANTSFRSTFEARLMNVLQLFSWPKES